jgi:hypothetical protein
MGAARQPMQTPSRQPQAPRDAKSLYPTLDIHFTVITNELPRNTVHYYNPEVLKHFVDLLNQKFISQARTRMVNFRFKSMTTYDEARAQQKSKACIDLVRSGQKVRNIFAIDFSDVFNRCRNSADSSPVLDPEAINVYIYDGWSAETDKSAFRDVTSTGNFNNGHPVVRIDYRRVYDQGEWNRWAVFQHEMGHAFNLKHVCNDEPNGTASTPTNIMSSANSWPATVEAQCDTANAYTGDRSIGFDNNQVNVIRNSLQVMQTKLTPPRPNRSAPKGRRGRL